MSRYLLLLSLVLLHTGGNIQAKTLYVGPSETYKTITAAMWDVVAGDTIMVRDGTYDKSVDIRSPLTLMAENRHKAIIGDGKGTEGIFKIKSSHVIIDGFTFNANPEWPGIILGGINSENKAVNCVIKNNVFINRQSGIRTTEDSENFIIEGNEITGSSDHGMVVNGKGVTISDNRIEGSGALGIRISTGASGFTSVTGNTIFNNGTNGIDIEKTDVNLSQNLIQGNSENGIRVAEGVQRIVIHNNNTIKDNRHGILVGSRANAIIESNTIQGNRERGIEVTPEGSAIITGNTIIKNGSYGILNYGSVTISGNTISENKVNGIENRPGSLKTLIEDNLIENNIENGVFLMERADFHANIISKNGRSGIFMEGPPGIVHITDTNQIQYNREHGIFIGQEGRAKIWNNTISNNGKGVTGSEDFSGILVFGSALVEENRIDSNGGGGITVGESSYNTVIRSNISIHGNREGIMMNGPASVENNKISNNLLQGIYIGPVKDIQLGGNSITGNRTGVFIHAEASGIYMYNCDLTANERGIASRGEIKVRRSTIENQTNTGIRILQPGIDLGFDSDEEGGYNTIRNNSPWNIVNATADTIHACRNFWDLTDSAGIDSTLLDDEEDIASGTIIFTPMLPNDITGREDPPAPSGDSDCELLLVYPNPFQDFTNLIYILPEPAHVTLRVFDVKGSELATLVHCRHHESGRHSLQWNGTANNGNKISIGFYIVLLQTDRRIQTKMLFIN